MTEEMMMAREQANPFRMLSAYLTTTATSSPPVAFIPTRYTTNRSYLRRTLGYRGLLESLDSIRKSRDYTTTCRDNDFGILATVRLRAH